MDDGAAPTQTVGQAVQRYAPHVLSATGGIAVLAYILLRIAAGRFYGRFGVSPEDVGIAQAELLGRSAGVAVIALLFAVVLAVAFAMVDEARRLKREGLSSGCVSAVLVAALGGLLYMVLRPISQTAGNIAEVVLVWAAVLGLALSAGLRVWQRPASRLVVSAFAGGLVLSVGVLITFLFLTASIGRGVVSRGQGISDWAEPWQATVVTVEWTEPGVVPLNVAHLACGVYLGSGAGKAIVVDPINHQTLWIPADKVVLRSYLSRGGAEPICTRNGVTLTETR